MLLQKPENRSKMRLSVGKNFGRKKNFTDGITLLLCQRSTRLTNSNRDRIGNNRVSCVCVVRYRLFNRTKFYTRRLCLFFDPLRVATGKSFNAIPLHSDVAWRLVARTGSAPLPYIYNLARTFDNSVTVYFTNWLLWRFLPNLCIVNHALYIPPS